jgi:exopolysaccharide biosynthesis polyprenyl glycosylphosphotransferase
MGRATNTSAAHKFESGATVATGFEPEVESPGRVALATLDPETLDDGINRLQSSAALKRALDIAASLGLLILLAPIMLITALAIRFESKGPALYRQRRVGLNGAEFDILKFRSMRADAEKHGAQWASVNDNRITRVGAIIRKTRIDEIPQAINVLRGEMSFVGPRPERPEFVWVLDAKIPHYQQRHRVKPGITGWAQVKHEYTSSVEGAREKLCYDLYYVQNFSIGLDLAIMVKTVRVALFGLGAR